MNMVKDFADLNDGAYADPPVLEDVAGSVVQGASDTWRSGREWAEELVGSIAVYLTYPDPARDAEELTADVLRQRELADTRRLLVSDIAFRLARPVEELVRRLSWDGSAEQLQAGLVQVLEEYVATYGLPEKPRSRR